MKENREYVFRRTMLALCRLGYHVEVSGKYEVTSPDAPQGTEPLTCSYASGKLKIEWEKYPPYEYLAKIIYKARQNTKYRFQELEQEQKKNAENAVLQEVFDSHGIALKAGDSNTFRPYPRTIYFQTTTGRVDVRLNLSTETDLGLLRDVLNCVRVHNPKE